jgi:hypothetical protein
MSSEAFSTRPPTIPETATPEPPQAFPGPIHWAGAATWCRWCGADLPVRAKPIRLGRRFCNAECKAEHDADVRKEAAERAEASEVES